MHSLLLLDYSTGDKRFHNKYHHKTIIFWNGNWSFFNDPALVVALQIPKITIILCKIFTKPPEIKKISAKENCTKTKRVSISRYSLVRKKGLEPSRCNHHKILSLARLPIPTLPQTFIWFCLALAARDCFILFLWPNYVNTFFDIFL